MRFNAQEHGSRIALIALALFAPWGSVFDIIEGAIPIGVSTLLVLCVLGLGALRPQFYQSFRNEPILLFGVLFVLGAMFGCFFSPFPLASFVRASMFLVFLLFSAAVSNIRFGPRYLTFLLACASGAVTAMVALSIIDYSGYVEIPHFNEIARRISLSEYSDLVDDLFSMSGPFRSRTELMSYVTLVLPITLWFSMGSTVGVLLRSYYLVNTVILLYGMVLAGSRGAYLATVAIICVYMFILSYRFEIKRVLIFTIAGFFISLVLVFVYSDIWIRFSSQLKTLMPQNLTARETDMGRFTLWRIALQNVLTRPFGVGFGSVQVSPGYFRTVHNVVIDLVHAGGVLALPFLYVLGRRFFSLSELMRANATQVPFYGVMLSFFIYNLTHSQWGTNLLWLLMGLFIVVCRPANRQNNFVQ